MFLLKKLTKTERSDSRGKFFLITKDWVNSNQMFPSLSLSEHNDGRTICIYDHYDEKKMFCNFIYHNSAKERKELKDINENTKVAKYRDTFGDISKAALIRALKTAPPNTNKAIEKYRTLQTKSLRNEYRIYYSPIEEDTYKAGDLILFYRDLSNSSFPTFHLHHFEQKKSQFYSLLNKELGSVNGNYKTLNKVANKLKEYLDLKKNNLHKFETHINSPKYSANEKLGESKKRDRLFRDVIIANYEFKCAISEDVISYKNHYCLDAAHIMGFSSGGPCKMNNGIAFSKNIHWLFDYGYFKIEKDLNGYHIQVHPDAPDKLKGTLGCKINVPKSNLEKPGHDFLIYHANNTYGRFKKLKINSTR